MNKRIYKAIGALLGAVAFSGQACATAIVQGPTLDDSDGKVGQGGIHTWDGGNIGYGQRGTSKANVKYPYYPPQQKRLGGGDPMQPDEEKDKDEVNYDPQAVDHSKNLGWNHQASFYSFKIETAGGYTISVDRTSAAISYQPAFSVWDSGSELWGGGVSHSFDPVGGPDGYNALGNAAGLPGYMRLPEGEPSIKGFVGYANSGPAFVTGGGSEARGALAFGTSTAGPLVDESKPYGGTNLYTSIVVKGAYIDSQAGRIEGPYAGVGSSVNTSNPALSNEAGGGHVDLKLWLKPGWYVMAAGGSCADFTCTATPEVTVSGKFRLTLMRNPKVTAPIPVASGGADQTNPLELSKVTLHGGGTDPKGTDISGYRWRQVSGPAVALVNPNSPTPSFIAPLVGAGTTETVGLELVVTDSSADCNGGPCASLPAAVSVAVGNDPAILDCMAAAAGKAMLWPANKKLVAVSIAGIGGAKPYSLAITGVTSDEPVRDKAAKDSTAPDAVIKKGKATKKQPLAMDSLQLRAERQIKQKNGAGSGNGRVYAVSFTANDGSRSCNGTVKVGVPAAQGTPAVDDGGKYNATAKK